MAIDESLVQEIVRRILTAAGPDKIILFGSAATGQMTRDSDLLVVEQDPGDRREKYVRSPFRRRMTLRNCLTSSKLWRQNKVSFFLACKKERKWWDETIPFRRRD